MPTIYVTSNLIFKKKTTTFLYVQKKFAYALEDISSIWIYWALGILSLFLMYHNLWL